MSCLVLEIKTKMLQFVNKINFIISEIRKARNIYLSQFELFVKYWQFNITLIYAKLKQNKSKRNMILLKKLLNISEIDRNLVINVSMKNAKIDFIKRMKEWKMRKNEHKLIGNSNESSKPTLLCPQVKRIIDLKDELFNSSSSNIFSRPKYFKRRAETCVIKDSNKIDLIPEKPESNIVKVEISQRPSFIFLPTREKISSIIMNIINQNKAK